MKLFYCFLFLIATTTVVAQDVIETTLIAKKELEADSFVSVDSFGNTYFIKDNVLHKESKDQKSWVYQNIQLGSITAVDILNPLKITVFYSDFNTAIILDNTLNEVKKIDFNTIIDFKNALFVTTAHEKNLWLFDTNTQQLEVFNYRNEKTIMHTQPIPETIVDMQSNYNYCYVLTPTSVLTFNIYGSLLSEFPVDTMEAIAMHNQNYILHKQNKLYFFNNQVLQPIKLPLKKIDIKQFSLQNDIMYIYDGMTLFQFQFKSPESETPK